MEELRTLVDSEPDSTSVAIEFADLSTFEDLSPLLKRLPCLQELSLQGNMLTALPADLSWLSTLRKLDISSNAFPALSTALAGLKSLPALRSLSFSFDSDDDEAMLLRELPALTELNDKAVHADPVLKSSRRNSTLNTSHSSMVSEQKDMPAKEVAREEEGKKEVAEMVFPDMNALRETAKNTLKRLFLAIREAGLPASDLKTEIEEGIKAALANYANDQSRLQAELISVAKKAYLAAISNEALRSAASLLDDFEKGTLEEAQSASKQRETALTGELERANIRITALNAEKDVLMLRLKEASQGLAQANEGFKSEIAVWEEKLSRAEGEIKGLKAEKESFAGTLDTLRGEKAALEQAIKESENRLGTSLSDREKQQQDTERLLNETQAQCKALETALQEGKMREESLSLALQQASSGSDSQHTALQALRAEMEKQATAAEEKHGSQLAALSADKAALEAQLSQLSNDKEQLQTTVAALRLSLSEAEAQSQEQIQMLKSALQEAQTVPQTPQITTENQQIQVEIPLSEEKLRRVVSQSPSRLALHSPRKGHTRMRSNAEKLYSLHQLLQTIATLHATKSHNHASKETYMEHLQASMVKTYGLKVKTK